MLSEFSLFGWTISTYWLMFALGLVGIFILYIVRRKKYNISVLSGLLLTLIMAVFGLLGAKILYILENIELVKLVGVKLGGLSFYGSVWLILLGMPAAGLLFKLRPRESLDSAAPGVAIMIALMRVGCFFNGCCGGITVKSATGSFTYPTQLIESIGDFIILFVLLEWERRKGHEGKLYPAFMVLYGILRFVVEFMRDTPKGLFGFSNGNWYSIASVLLGGGYLVYRLIKDKKVLKEKKK